MADDATTDTTADTATGDGTPSDLSTLSPEDLVAEVEKWKVMSRKHEAAAKKGSVAAAKLAEIEQANLTALEKEQQARKAAEDRANTLELQHLQTSVASAKKLPSYMAGRLKGTTQAELEADADAILKEINAGKTPANLRQGNNGKPAEPATDMNSFIRKMAGR